MKRLAVALSLSGLGLIGCLSGSDTKTSPAPLPQTADVKSSSLSETIPNEISSPAALAELSGQEGVRSLRNYTGDWDNRVGASPKRDPKTSSSALRIFHSFEPCRSSPCPVGAPAVRLYTNAPLGNTPAALREASTSAFATHNVGIYLRSHGQIAAAQDPTQSIAPSGILLEPHGSHHAIRIDSQNSATSAVRIEVPTDGQGILLIGNARPSTYCDGVAGGDCKSTQGKAILFRARNGVVDLSNTQLRREISRDDGQLFASRSSAAVGEVRWLRWTHATGDGLMSCSCVFLPAGTLQKDSWVRVTPAQPGDLTRPHSYSVRSVWTTGNAPMSCRGGQIARPDPSKPAYTIGAPPAQLIERSSGFESCLHLSTGEEPPGTWDPSRAPSFIYELLQSS